MDIPLKRDKLLSVFPLNFEYLTLNCRQWRKENG